MPGLVRKFLVIAAIDGLILQPLSGRNQSPSTGPISIKYKSGSISPFLKDVGEQTSSSASIEAHGVVGLLNVSSSTFLVSISRREQVAQIRGKPVYVITDVALIPLSSQADAEKAINQTKSSLKQRYRNEDFGGYGDTEDSGEEDEASVSADESLPEEVTPPDSDRELKAPKGHQRKTSVAEDVLKNKGQYGRFAEKWFSRRGWSTEQRKSQGMSSEEDLTRRSQPQAQPSEDETAAKGVETLDFADKSQETVKEEGIGSQGEPITDKAHPPGENTLTTALLPKILRTTKIFFGSRSFFFSYDYDISHSVGKQENGGSSLPLFKTFDPLFFWNHHLIDPFVQSGQQGFVLPVIQGFVGQRAFTVNVTKDDSASKIIDTAHKIDDVVAAQDEAAKNPETDRNQDQKDFLLTLISRRSIKRAGLRYLRRGVDDEGHTANSVETEQILSSPSWDPTEKLYSFLQIRGSIPLFFHQSPYSLKPIPVMYAGPEKNQAAFKQHFQSIASRYGGIHCASLVDKHGTEAKIGQAYEDAAKQLNSSGGINNNPIGFEWFDFHYICRGMKFENVSILIDSLKDSFTSFGWTIQQDSTLTSSQSGVVRTNCMDCLDRTNVVQSAIARAALEQQLSGESITIDLQKDPSTSWFNTLWADNGDAISRQYAGTAALKGDYTRTRKRNISGALNDFGLTLSRYYNNIVNDYFTQACIDFYLGNASTQVFDDFESDMVNKDYALDLRKARQSAIESCVRIVLGDPPERDLLGAWTLAAPEKANTLRTLPFEECVLLLTEDALFFCRFDWTTEKVREFEQIDLDRVVGLYRGAYITSTLAAAHTDEKKNVGLVIRYHASDEDTVRVMNRSLDNEKRPEDEDEQNKGKQTATKGGEERILAFKALPPKSSVANVEGASAGEKLPSEAELVKQVCDEIVRAATKASKGEETLQVEEKDVISAADAKKSTGYLEQVGYSLKKLVWG